MSLKQPQKIRVNFDDLDLIDIGVAEPTMGYNGQLFTGYAVIQYYPDGSVQLEEEYRNGEIMGWTNEYYSNGIIKEDRLCVWDTGNSILINRYDQTGTMTKSMRAVSQEQYDKFVNQFNLLT